MKIKTEKVVRKTSDAQRRGSMGNASRRKTLPFLSRCVGLLLLFVFLPSVSSAAESICARVKIEIKQELTLERQAFDANMIINNGLDTIALENVAIEVNFTDENGLPVLASSDPNNTSAKFFIRIDSMNGIDNVSGSGTVQPASTADIHWLIIPAPGAGGVLPSGKLYFVGARLTYTFGGKTEETVVSPDYIYVKPLPQMTLDYFLPADVYADDAFTPQIEPPVPFTLGVRILNSGSGVANNVNIDSAQPRIIENEQDLLINFKITGSYVDDQPSEPDLLINFGDIDPNEATMGRWIMNTTLSGEFVEFTAEFSHADDLGGQLTSLIDAVNTHTLVRDVLVDLPGRDSVRDFLARDAGLQVFESNGVDTSVTDQSGNTSLGAAGQSGTQIIYSLDGPATGGFFYVKLSDPQAGTREITRALRSDGKEIPLDNVWLSKERQEDNSWNYFVNLFDVNTTGDYTLFFGVPFVGPQPPLMQFIPDRSTFEGNQISFIVEASDPNGTLPALTAAPLPAGASYIDQGDGVAIFDWTPAIGQAGLYQIVFTASDGALDTSQMAQIFVSSDGDTDGDGMEDAWELEYFGTLDRDGNGDFDGDGLPDQQEFEEGTDPLGLDGPVAPMILSPWFREEVLTVEPVLTVVNGKHAYSGATLTYEYELYADPELTMLLASSGPVAETADYTSWTVPAPLPDNQPVHWRVRAFDGTLYSNWVYGRFFVNTANDAPGAFGISYPSDGTAVDSTTPQLEVTNSLDPDNDTLTYVFEVFSDAALNNLVSSSGDVAAGANGSTAWQVPVSLTNNVLYYWQVTASDADGLSRSTEVGSFLVDTANAAPQAPTLAAPADWGIENSLDVLLQVNNGIDADGDSLAYLFEIDTVDTFDSPDKASSGPITAGAAMTDWMATALTDNTEYFWRAKATDGLAESGWVTGRFRVSTANVAPASPVGVNPADSSWDNRLQPLLRATQGQNVHRDALTYRYEVYSDSALTALIAGGTTSGSILRETLPVLTDHSWYYWRIRAEDSATQGLWAGPFALYINQSEVTKPADLDANGVVDSPDLARIMSNWGALGAEPTDLDLDGQTSDSDLEQLLLQFIERTDAPSTD